MINESELREMSAAERRRLARALAAIDYPHPLLGIYLARGRRLGALVSIVSCAVLAGWLIVLALTLHRSFHSHYWRGAWVGYDFILVSAFAATGWAFWRGRQIVIACLLVTGTLLCCDAWFDVVLDLGTGDVWTSVASALLVELPMALLMFEAARRLIRLSALVAMSESGGLPGPGERKPLPPLWKIPLFGVRADPPGGGPAPARDLTSSPWLPISPRKPRLPPSPSPSRRTPAPGCARSWSRSSSTCTRSPVTSS